MKTTVEGLQHIGIPTEDIDATISFYEGIGFQTVLLTEGKLRQKVAFLQLNNLVIETYEVCKVAEITGSIDHLALEVSDIKKAYNEITACGYTIIEGEIQFLPFWEKGVYYFTIHGPNMEKIEFNQRIC